MCVCVNVCQVFSGAMPYVCVSGSRVWILMTAAQCKATHLRLAKPSQTQQTPGYESSDVLLLVNVLNLSSVQHTFRLRVYLC